MGGAGARGLCPPPAAKLDALLDGMAEVIDAAGGSFTMRYATVATAAVKVGAPTGR